MSEHDTVQRFIFENHPIRGEIVRLNSSFHTVMQQHAYPAVVQKLLGETLLAAILLAQTIKFKGQLTIQLQSTGPIRLLVAKCNYQRHIRGLAQWDFEALSDEIIAAMGEGKLVITMDRDDLVQPYQNIVPLEHRGVMESLEFYFGQSEQLPTKFFSHVEKDHAAAIMLQMMPSDKIQDRENFWQMVSRVQDSQIRDQSNKTILETVFADNEIRLFDSEPVAFRCNCSTARMEQAIRTLGQQDALDILQSKQEIVVTCEYCNNEYGFNREDVMRIFTEDQ